MVIDVAWQKLSIEVRHRVIYKRWNVASIGDGYLNRNDVANRWSRWTAEATDDRIRAVFFNCHVMCKTMTG